MVLDVLWEETEAGRLAVDPTGRGENVLAERDVEGRESEEEAGWSAETGSLWEPAQPPTDNNRVVRAAAAARLTDLANFERLRRVTRL